jgi:hypothetical protein
VALRDDRLLELRSFNATTEELVVPLDDLDDPPAWASASLRVLKALSGGRAQIPGSSLLSYCHVPPRLGMAPEAALTAAVALAYADLAGTELSEPATAALGDPAAQLAAAYCPAGCALLVDRRTAGYEILPFDLEGCGLKLLMIQSSAGGAAPGFNPETTRQAAKTLGSGNPGGLGPLLWNLDGCGSLEVQGRAAIEAGALGVGLVPGAVDSDPVLTALVPTPRIRAVRAALRNLAGESGRVRFIAATSARGGATPLMGGIFS